MFGAFVIAEIIGSFAGSSLSLLGDAAAMSIDVFTVSTLPQDNYLHLIYVVYDKYVCREG